MFEDQQKFVFAGEVGAGKTTAIRTVSESEILSMEVPLSEAIDIPGKLTTTVGFDFAILQIAETPLFLYGTPGQDRFRFVARDLLDGALGVILLVNLGQRDALQALCRWLSLISAQAPRAPVLVALNRPQADGLGLSEVRECAAQSHPGLLGVVTADPRSRLEMLNCLRMLTLAQLHQTASPDPA